MAKTPCRVDVLRILSSEGSALSEVEIRQRLSFEYDRATLFRTLRSFVQAGIIHSITVEGKDVRYALSVGEETRMRQFHAHFYCRNCHKVYCLCDISFREPVLPLGFKIDNYDLIINGECNNCSSKV